MKNLKKTICILLLSPFGLLGQEKKYTLNGQIPVFGEQDKVYLLKGNQPDSTAIKTGGNFTFEGTISAPVKAYVLIGKTLRDGYRQPFTLYLEEGNINLVSKDSLKNATVQAGKANVHHAELTSLLQPLNEEQSDLYGWYRKLPKDQQEAEETKHKLDNTNKRLSDERKKINRQFLQSNNDSPIALDILKTFAGYSPEYDEVFPVYQQLSEEVKSSEDGVKYLEELKKYEALSIGRVAPNFSQADTAGRIVSLKDFRGKYVLIDFWASWCGPCRAENPNVVTAYHAFKDKGFTIIGVSLDNEKGRDAWLKAIADDKLQDWTQLSDLQGWKNEAATLYGVRAIPSSFLLDPEGHIIAKNLSGEYLEKKLKEVLD